MKSGCSCRLTCLLCDCHYSVSVTGTRGRGLLPRPLSSVLPRPLLSLLPRPLSSLPQRLHHQLHHRWTTEPTEAVVLCAQDLICGKVAVMTVSAAAAIVMVVYAKHHFQLQKPKLLLLTAAVYLLEVELQEEVQVLELTGGTESDADSRM
jgi:hypothetical protein